MLVFQSFNHHISCTESCTHFAFIVFSVPYLSLTLFLINFKNIIQA